MVTSSVPQPTLLTFSTCIFLHFARRAPISFNTFAPLHSLFSDMCVVISVIDIFCCFSIHSFDMCAVIFLLCYSIFPSCVVFFFSHISIQSGRSFPASHAHYHNQFQRFICVCSLSEKENRYEYIFPLECFSLHAKTQSHTHRDTLVLKKSGSHSLSSRTQ